MFFYLIMLAGMYVKSRHSASYRVLIIMATVMFGLHSCASPDFSTRLGETN
jgi:hypothetical protein